MSGTIDIYDGRSLTQAINQIIVPETFLLSTLFNNVQYHISYNIDIEIYRSSSTLALFADKEAEAKLIKKRTRKVQTITVPRTFEKKVFTAKELADYRNIGNIYLADEATIMRQSDDYVAQELEVLKNRIQLRREQMAAVSLDTGALSISQDDLEFDLDYGYTSDQKKTLTGVNLWSAATTGKPLNDIRGWKRAILRLKGIVPSIMILGSDAAAAFINNDQVQKFLETYRGFGAGQFELNNGMTQAGSFICTFLGIDVYEYTQQYVTVDASTSVETAHSMIGDNKAILVAKSPEFRIHYSPAYRIADGGLLQLLNQDMYIESQVSADRTKLEWRVEQNSIPTIHDPNCVISAVVA